MRQEKIETLLAYTKSLCDSDLDRIISFTLGIVSTVKQMPDRPGCPYCGETHVIKYGYIRGKQRFMCRGCNQTFLHTTNTLMAESHSSASVWADFIRDTLHAKTLDECAAKFGFHHETAFNMRHKLLMALEDLLKKQPVLLSGISEFDETFVLECYKGAPVPEEAGRGPRKRGAVASKPGISSEYVAICTGIQRDGGVIAEAVNRAKPSSDELRNIFRGRIAEGTLALTDGLRSYHVLEALSDCAVVNVNKEQNKRFFHLNTVNRLHSFIKQTYVHFRGVATKYINRYNALFSIAFRCTENLANELFSSVCFTSRDCFWHSVKEISTHKLVVI